MSPPPKPDASHSGCRSDRTIRQALDRALHHLQQIAVEGVACTRALLDAASIAILGEPAKQHPDLADLAATLDQIEAALAGEAPSFRKAALSKLLSAVDREIARWEDRSRRDPDARAVLRVFLGMREVLWELHARQPGSASAEPAQQSSRDAARTTSSPAEDPNAKRKTRVQRIEIQG